MPIKCSHPLTELFYELPLNKLWQLKIGAGLGSQTYFKIQLRIQQSNATSDFVLNKRS